MSEPRAPRGYDAAHQTVARFDLSRRTRLIVAGRAPGQMLGGVLTGHIPASPGTRHYSAVLTPKGRMITDLFLVRFPGDEERFALDVSEAGRTALLEYFKRVLPPRFAKVEDVTEEWSHVALVGPEAATALSRALDKAGIATQDPTAFESLQPDGVWYAEPATGPIWVARSPDTVPPRYDVFFPHSDQSLNEDARLAIGEALADAVPEEGDSEAWNALRIEAGTPEFGTDMTENTIPIEAGIEARAIDGSKGCYTGQEIIVRILHRGHVNRHLRTLRLAGDVDASEISAADELFVEGSDKAVGFVTSVVASPRTAATLALGYVRREVEVGQVVRIGSPTGVGATVFQRGPIS